MVADDLFVAVYILDKLVQSHDALFEPLFQILKLFVPYLSRNNVKREKLLLESAVFIDAEPHAISCQQFIYNV